MVKRSSRRALAYSSAVSAFLALSVCCATTSFLRTAAYMYSAYPTTRRGISNHNHCKRAFLRANRLHVHHDDVSETALFLLGENTGEGAFGGSGEASNKKDDDASSSSSSSSSSYLAASTSNTTIPTTTSSPDSPKKDKSTSAFSESSSSSTQSTSTNIPPETLREAQELQKRAQELKAEAQAMEAALQESKSNLSQQEQTDSQDLFNRLFHTNRPRTPHAVARVLREERWSVDQAILVLKLLYEQQRMASGADTVVTTTTKTRQQQQQNTTTFPAPPPPPPPPSIPPTVNQTQLEVVESYVQCLLEAAALLDEETLQATGFSNSLLLLNSRQNYGNNNNNTRNTRWSGRGEQALRSQWKSWQRSDEKEWERLLAVTIQAAIRGSTERRQNNNNVSSSVEEYVRQTLGLGPASTNNKTNDGLNQFNMSRLVERVSLVPLWVPSPLIKFMVASRALLESDDVKAIKERVLPASRFYCTSVDSIPSAALFRGNIRNNIISSKENKQDDAENKEQSPLTAAVFSEIQDLMDREQLSSRVQLLFMPDPEWRPNRDEREPKPKPVLLAIPKAVVPDESLLEQEQSMAQSIGKKVAVGLAFLTTLTYSVSCYALNPKFFESVINQQDIATVSAALPLFVGVCAVSAIHEIAHRLVAHKRGMKIGWPIPLPSVQFGIFGCITPLRSFPPNRAALLDFALSGPVAALVVSVLLMVFGIHQTVHATPMALQNFPVVPMAVLKSSFLTSSLLTILAPKVMMLPLSQPIPIHPSFMVGFSGLIVSALNLLPIFRLDGGRACSAAMGPRFGGIASVSTLLFLLSAALSGTSGVAWAFGVLILFFQRRPEIPVRDDATEVDDFRLGTWVASLLTSVLALAPFPGGPGLL